jgi:hypothetical protein
MARFVITYDVLGNDDVFEFRTAAPDIDAAKDDFWWQVWCIRGAPVNGILGVYEIKGRVAPRHAEWLP